MMKLALALLVVAAFVAPAADAAAACSDTTGTTFLFADCHCSTDTTTEGDANCGGSFGDYCDAGTCSDTHADLGDCGGMSDNDWKNLASGLMGGCIAATIIAFIGCGLATAIVCQCGCGPGLNGNAMPIAGVALLTGAIGSALPFFLIGPVCKSVTKKACNGETETFSAALTLAACKGGGFVFTYMPPRPGCLGLGAGIGSCVCACLIFCKCCKYGEFVKGGANGAAAQGTVVVQGAAA